MQNIAASSLATAGVRTPRNLFLAEPIASFDCTGYDIRVVFDFLSSDIFDRRKIKTQWISRVQRRCSVSFSFVKIEKCYVSHFIDIFSGGGRGRLLKDNVNPSIIVPW